MQKWEYSSLVFKGNDFIFYESNHEPKSIFQIKNSSIFGFSNKLDPDFYQAIIKVINEIAGDGWELVFFSPEGLTWFFKRPIEG